MAASDDPDWFQIVNPTLTDANQGLKDVCSNPTETSLVDDDNASGEDNYADDEEQEQNIGEEIGNNDDDGEEQEEMELIPARKVVAKPHAKRSAARSQLAAGVNKLADVNAKRLKVEEKDRLALKFRREEAEKNRKHEKEIAEVRDFL